MAPKVAPIRRDRGVSRDNKRMATRVAIEQPQALQFPAGDYILLAQESDPYGDAGRRRVGDPAHNTTSSGRAAHFLNSRNPLEMHRVVRNSVCEVLTRRHKTDPVICVHAVWL